MSLNILHDGPVSKPLHRTDRQKNDEQDADWLARMFLADSSKAMRVPSVEEENVATPLAYAAKRQPIRNKQNAHQNPLDQDVSNLSRILRI